MKSLRHSVCLAVALLAGSMGSAVSVSAQPVYGYQVINQYPHDTAAFTQGLVLPAAGCSRARDSSARLRCAKSTSRPARLFGE